MALSKEDVLNAIAEMSVMDIVELISDMEEKFGVTAAVAAAAPAAAAEGAALLLKKKTSLTLFLLALARRKLPSLKPFAKPLVLV